MSDTDHPLHVDSRGRTAEVGRSGHLRDLVEQVLFTAPGERVMRPGFGAGVVQLLFEPAGPEVAATTKLLVESSLQQWLGDVIQVRGVTVVADDGAFYVDVAYAERRSGVESLERFTVPGGAG